MTSQKTCLLFLSVLLFCYIGYYYSYERPVVEGFAQANYSKGYNSKFNYNAVDPVQKKPAGACAPKNKPTETNIKPLYQQVKERNEQEDSVSVEEIVIFDKNKPTPTCKPKSKPKPQCKPKPKPKPNPKPKPTPQCKTKPSTPPPSSKCKSKPSPASKCKAPPSQESNSCPRYIPPPTKEKCTGPKCGTPIIQGCEKSCIRPQSKYGKGKCDSCVCPNYPEMSQYMLKSKIPNTPDMSKFVPKSEIGKIVKDKQSKFPTVDLSNYILKSKLPSCPIMPDMSQYVMKSSIPPPCKKCLDSPCGRSQAAPPPKPKPRICCPKKPPAQEYEPAGSCCECDKPSESKGGGSSGEGGGSSGEGHIIPEEEYNFPHSTSNEHHPSHSNMVQEEVNNGIAQTITHYQQKAPVCKPFFKHESSSNGEPVALQSGSFFK